MARANGACSEGGNSKRNLVRSSGCRSAARRAIDDWLHYACRSKLLRSSSSPARSATTGHRSKHHRMELTNGLAESNNAEIGRLRTNARGFHDYKAFITMIMLDRGGHTPNLPWATAMTHESVSCPRNPSRMTD